MDIKLHKQATTTPMIRAEIQAAPSNISDSELARQYGLYDRLNTRHITARFEHSQARYT